MAFISYSHRTDRTLAPAVQSALNRFARPWYRLRWVRIFRDDTDLGVSPHLWSSIQEALTRSEHFLLLASPQAAASPWVRKEVEYWRAHRSTDQLLIVCDEDPDVHCADPDRGSSARTVQPPLRSGPAVSVPPSNEARSFMPSKP